jgi:hypothetical protein
MREVSSVIERDRVINRWENRLRHPGELLIRSLRGWPSPHR